MCAYYDDEQKIKKDDCAYYKNKPVTIISVTHIKENRTMDIVIKYEKTDVIKTVNIPYKISGYGFVKTNIMGSAIENGYECKPKVLNPNKPIMHYKTLVYVCDDIRCGKAGGENKTKYLRKIVKDLGLEKGKKRIKISRNMCQGACRFRQVMQINENTKSNGYEPNNGIWLKHTHQYDKEHYEKLFVALSTNQSLNEFEQIDMKVYK